MRKNANWICRACGTKVDSWTFNVLCSRTLPESSSFQYGECTSCHSLTLIDDVDPSPWYLNGYERHRTSSHNYRLTAASRMAGIIGEQMLRRITVAPHRWFPPSPTWVAQFRGSTASLNSRILDVGCGQGALLLHFSRFGFTNLEGIDPFLPESSAQIGSVTLERRNLDEMTGEFGVIYFNHSLEHVDDPETYLTLARDRLSPGGVVVVDLPIVGGRSWRRFRSNWVGLDAPLHRWIPTPDGMKRLASRAGLQLVRWHGSSTTYFYEASLIIQNGASPHGVQPVEFLGERMHRWCIAQARKDRAAEGSQASFVFTLAN